MPAAVRIHIPNDSTSSPAPRPASPTAMQRVTRGTATRFVTGPTKGTVLNAGTVSGMVTTCATTLAARAGASFDKGRGRDVRAHAVASVPRRTRPTTALTDKAKPKSNAAAGLIANIPMQAIGIAESGSPRLPETMAPPAAANITNARNVDARQPDIPRYATANMSTHPTWAGSGRCARRASNHTIAASTARCVPETASRCATPLKRNASSAAVPRSRSRLPINTPSSSAPPSPPITANRSRHHTRTGPSLPVTLPDHEPISPRTARPCAAVPLRHIDRAQGSLRSGTANLVANVTERPASGTSSPDGHTTST